MDNTTTPETWKPVVGYEGHYEVSDHGRVRSLDRTLTRVDGVARRWPGRVLRHNTVGKGYHAVTLRAPGLDERKYVHRLVMAAFVGLCPPGMEVCHADGDPLNNALRNLRYDTYSSNNMDKAEHGTATRGERNAGARRTQAQVREIRTRVAAGERPRQIASDYPVTASTVEQVARRSTWAWLD